MSHKGGVRIEYPRLVNKRERSIKTSDQHTRLYEPFINLAFYFVDSNCQINILNGVCMNALYFNHRKSLCRFLALHPNIRNTTEAYQTIILSYSQISLGSDPIHLTTAKAGNPLGLNHPYPISSFQAIN